MIKSFLFNEPEKLIVNATGAHNQQIMGDTIRGTKAYCAVWLHVRFISEHGQ